MKIKFIMPSDHEIIYWAPYNAFVCNTDFANAVNAQCGTDFGPGDVRQITMNPQSMVNSGGECIRIV